MDSVEKFAQELLALFKSAVKPKTNIIKATLQEERKALFVVMEPEVPDAHNDVVSEEEIMKACNNFNLHCMKANVFHLVDTEAVEIQQSFVTLSEAETESGRVIQKGTWMMWMHFPKENAESDLLWDMVKTQELNGVSIGALGVREEIE